MLFLSKIIKMYWSFIIIVIGTSLAMGSSNDISWKKPGCHRIRHKRDVRIPDCVEFELPTYACRGYCESWALPSPLVGYARQPVTSLGQCCNMMDAEDVEVKVSCLDGVRTYHFKSATSCACYHCQKD